MKENNKEEKDSIDIEFTKLKADPENDENAIDYRWSNEQLGIEKDVAEANLIESLQK